jgi:Uri superfamily endonuclease
MDSRPGTYVLLLEAVRPRRIAVGRRLGRWLVRPGWYLYVGSAFGPGGLAARLAHHCRPLDTATRRAHWHVDHLRRAARPRAVWYTTDRRPHEVAWARALAALPEAVIPLVGFGASDSPVASHLFYFAAEPDFERFKTLLARAASGGGRRRIALHVERFSAGKEKSQPRGWHRMNPSS